MEKKKEPLPSGKEGRAPAIEIDVHDESEIARRAEKKHRKAAPPKPDES